MSRSDCPLDAVSDATQSGLNADSADYEKRECESSYLLESIVFYALMQRYSLAELSPCAEAYWASFDGEEPFMNNAGTNRFPEDCA